MHPDEVTVQDMKRALDDPQLGIQVLDVREPDEYQIARIDGAPLMPLARCRSASPSWTRTSPTTSTARRADAR